MVTNQLGFFSADNEISISAGENRGSKSVSSRVTTDSAPTGGEQNHLGKLHFNSLHFNHCVFFIYNLAINVLSS
jgi:hypothetical protein